MVNIENIYICMIAPILISAFFLPKEYAKILIFTIAGMTACLFSAYINVFFANVYETDIALATVEIAPLIEEVMKILPILFYCIIFNPDTKKIYLAVLIVAVSFATFENVCYLVVQGMENFQYVFMRGFVTGSLHLVCGLIVGVGLMFIWEEKWLRVIGSFALLCVAVTYHGLYNLLVSESGILQIVGSLMPILTLLAFGILKKRIKFMDKVENLD